MPSPLLPPSTQPVLVPIHAGVENRRERRRKAAATQSVQAAPTPCSPTQAGIPKGRDVATSPVPNSPRRRINQAASPPFAREPSPDQPMSSMLKSPPPLRR
ncbi:hypothetical protein M0R45_002363 [Rubus argutus]|uniref:Uncharacterized protein n=1 Tax=Rubus argutus TaxID=59490 RepID=A0AAW1VJU3_RUBAR